MEIIYARFQYIPWKKGHVDRMGRMAVVKCNKFWFDMITAWHGITVLCGGTTGCRKIPLTNGITVGFGVFGVNMNILLNKQSSFR